MKTTYVWKGVQCTVEAPPAVGRRVAALFPELARPTSDSKSVDLRVVSGPTGFAAPGLDGAAWPTVPEAVSACELALTRFLLSREREHTHLHAAAALTGKGEAVLALGPSGSGKSSVAYAWYRMGRPVFGDDVVALDPEARLHPFPRPLKVDVARMREAGESPRETVAWDGRAPDAWVDPTLGAGWAPGGVPVRLFAEIRFVAGAPLRATPVEGGERLRLLLDAMHQTGAPPSPSVDRLIRVAEGAEAIRLEHGDARALAGMLLERAGGFPH